MLIRKIVSRAGPYTANSYVMRKPGVYLMYNMPFLTSSIKGVLKDGLCLANLNWHII